MGKVIRHDNFFYLSGLLMYEVMGKRPMAFRRRIVNEYKKFVDARGGTEAFSGAEEAVGQFLNELNKGENRGPRRRH